ncbi:hypothetical protein S40288_04820 [Stachybotrys chartarum IBT 40288]|nr:hypothetical protein S40288_04820 [Stachybotrys chartarum IBT 40288]
MSLVRLSDGKVLPRGASAMVPGGPISRDSIFYEDAGRFDGLRFYRPNGEDDAAPGNTQQDYTAIESGNLSWGNGRLLLEYDVSLPNGQAERPSNFKYDTEVHPDFGQKIVLRKRRDA